jgi:dimeric dUTPase (all-alpha-NTP-PPase superfamily)
MLNLQDLLKDHQLYHSELQQDYFITIRAGGTTYGQYKQALRELFKRYRGLKELYTNKELLQVDIDELAVKTTCNQFEQRRNEINLRKKQGDMIELDKNIEDTEREFKRFYQQANALKVIIGDLTDEKRKQLDADMWEYKIKEMAAIDFLSHGRLQNNTVELIGVLPMAMRERILELIVPDNQHKLIEWFEGKNGEEILLTEGEMEVKKLIGG